MDFVLYETVNLFKIHLQEFYLKRLDFPSFWKPASLDNSATEHCTEIMSQEVFNKLKTPVPIKASDATTLDTVRTGRAHSMSQTLKHTMSGCEIVHLDGMWKNEFNFIYMKKGKLILPRLGGGKGITSSRNRQMHLEPYL